MSHVVPKDEAEKLVLSYQPKTIKRGATKEAKEYVEREDSPSQDFNISPIVAEATSISELRHKKMEEKVEAAVLERIKSVQEDAYAKAYELGLKEGAERAFSEASERLTDRISKVDEVLENFEHVKVKVLKENESAIVKLIFEVAKKIAWREIQLDQEPIINMLNDIVEGVQTDEKMLVRLSQSDFDFLTEIREKAPHKLSELNRVKLAVADDIEVGGCILETNFGAIDATVAERVSRAWDEINGKRPYLKDHNTDLVDNKDDDESESESE